MTVYIIRSCYENDADGTEDCYVEDVFSSIEKAAEYIREFDPENDIYVIDSGLVYLTVHDVDLPRRHLSSKDSVRMLTVYCERWEVK